MYNITCPTYYVEIIDLNDNMTHSFHATAKCHVHGLRSIFSHEWYTGTPDVLVCGEACWKLNLLPSVFPPVHTSLIERFTSVTL